jgi:hypothetical protein
MPFDYRVMCRCGQSVIMRALPGGLVAPHEASNRNKLHVCPRDAVSNRSNFEKSFRHEIGTERSNLPSERSHGDRLKSLDPIIRRDATQALKQAPCDPTLRRVVTECYRLGTGFDNKALSDYLRRCASGSRRIEAKAESPASPTAKPAESELMRTLRWPDTYLQPQRRVRQVIASSEAVHELTCAIKQGPFPDAIEVAAALVAKCLSTSRYLIPVDVREAHAWVLWSLVGLFDSARARRVGAARLVACGLDYALLRKLDAISNAGHILLARLVDLFLHEERPSPFVPALSACAKISERELQRIGDALRQTGIQRMRKLGYAAPYVQLPQDVSCADFGGFLKAAKSTLHVLGEGEGWTDMKGRHYSPPIKWTENSGQKGGFPGATGASWRDVE